MCVRITYIIINSIDGVVGIYVFFLDHDKLRTHRFFLYLLELSF